VGFKRTSPWTGGEDAEFPLVTHPDEHGTPTLIIQKGVAEQWKHTFHPLISGVEVWNRLNSPTPKDSKNLAIYQDPQRPWKLKVDVFREFCTVLSTTTLTRRKPGRGRRERPVARLVPTTDAWLASVAGRPRGSLFSEQSLPRKLAPTL